MTSWLQPSDCHLTNNNNNHSSSNHSSSNYNSSNNNTSRKRNNISSGVDCFSTTRRGRLFLPSP
eukprot:m.178511 g.178511  ORF g.178511 m.178511 type:complete len:64 (+) comp17982_c0_seq8:2073-2264(+)